MRPRRGNQEGSVYRRTDGRWAAVISEIGGKRRFIYAPTRKEASRKLNAALRDQTLGLPTIDGSIKLDAWLDRWLASSKPRLRPSTFARYEGLVRTHLKPALGHLKLAVLTPDHVEEFLRRKLGEGAAPASVHYMRGTLRTALGRAMKRGLVGRNVAALADAPRQVRREIVPLSAEEIDRFLTRAKGERLYNLYVTMLGCGLRRGEALGLRWRDVNIERRELSIQQAMQRVDGSIRAVELKTVRSRRVLPIASVVVNALRTQFVQQQADRSTAAGAWEEHGLVFTTGRGTPLDGTNVLRDFKRVLKECEIATRRIHDLRHSCATLLLIQGVPARVVMEMLGHSTIKLTMDTYSHVIPSLEKEAATRLDEFFSQRGQRSRLATKQTSV